MDPKKLVLIDGHSILNRAFYGIPELTNSEGIHTNAVYGFLNILFKILDEEKADYLAVAFDLSAPTFRHEMFPEYKGTRKGMPDELREQVPVMKEVLNAMGVKIVEKAGYEADDILGTLAQKSEKEGLEVSVVSGDRDLLQLATEHIKIRIPKTKRTGTEIEDYYEKDVVEKYQINPKQIIELKALMGDSSDNIPGLPGVGEKTATKIIVEYGNIENAFDHVELIKPNRAKEAFKEHFAQAEMSKKLATICTECDIDFQIEELKIGLLYTEDAYLLFKRLDFKNLLTRFNCDVPVYSVEENFKYVSDLNQVEEIFEKGQNSKNASIVLIGGNHLLGAALEYSDEETFFIGVEGFVTEEYLLEKVEKLLEQIDQVGVLDLKHELKFLNDKERNNIYDLGIAAYLLNPLRNSYLYDEIAKDYLGMLIPSKEDLLGKASLEEAFNQKEEFTKFACYCAYVAFKAMPVLIDKLKETEMFSLYQTIEMPLIYTLYHMETYGVKVEKEALEQYGQQLKIRIDELEKIIYEQAEEQFNINSPKQLGVVLFEKLKMPHAKKTKTGYSTAADVLEKLAADYPIVSNILEYRQLSKLKSTYADGLANYIQDDLRIHSTFNQTITATGRISSTEPNLQNIPIRMDLGRLIRKVFIPEKDYVFLDADYSQIELRVLAHMSGDEMLIKAYNEAQDIHRITASQVFHIPFEEVTSLQRSNAKAVNFGIVYGISSFGLSQGLSISRKEAADYIQKYFETYPKIKGFLDKLVEEGKANGYICSVFGRRRPIPELSSSNFMQRSFGERVAMNSPIQGTAADIIKIAMIRVDQELRRQGLKSRLVLQVHDELLVEAYKDELSMVKEILSEEMKNAAKLDVTLEIEMNQGQNWYETK
ncbi:DNA polymerase I [Anaerosacchariphilus polymeriproducens]|uniref:DNA polymerase I n=1 Tax=Anaerosacchariphilus polymeriproducens TaxID=1812858 RepID=A0A371ATM7_9FIRM|nr:DNA polymerase I [Anaerosacchariphilus polymeriproducens]RDU22892.1 DNA polymerase I [Anaerosacchariphilus polymeriproducens]